MKSTFGDRRQAEPAIDMTISSVTSTQPTLAVAQIAQPPAAPPAAASDPTGGTQLSRFGQFLSKLQSLEQSDPAQAKQVLETIASKVKDPTLAQKFQQAAQTGDLSGLQPPAQGAQGAQAGGHHHGHHHRGASAYQQSQQSTSTSTDPTQMLLDALGSTSPT